MDRLARRYGLAPWQVDWDSPEVAAWLVRSDAVADMEAKRGG